MARKKNEVPSRKAEFLATGAKLASKVGVDNVTRRAIAAAHHVSDPLVGKHVGGKDDLRKGIKSMMKKLGLSEPDADTAAAKGKALRARKATGSAAAKPRAKKLIAAKKVAAKKSKKTARPAAGGIKPASTTKRVASPGKPADPKKGAPSRKVVKKAPSNKTFAPKLPPLPALPQV